MEPRPTGQSPVLWRLPNIRAVLFDVYGTLLVSDSGEVGTTPEAACQEAMGGAFQSLGFRHERLAAEGVRLLLEAIAHSHQRSRQQGVECPEVDIVEVWRQVVARLAAAGLLDPTGWSDDRLRRLAIEYEGRANPVWPMPGLRDCLARLDQKGLILGIISNAQFYTPRLFPALLGVGSQSLGFDPDLQYYSYQYGQAKPGRALHEMAAAALAERGIEPGGVLYVGNDRLNDVYPSVQVGFRTALFAGDARSFRPRHGDPHLAGVSPDLLLTELAELDGCV